MNYPPTWDFKKHGKVLEGTYVGAFHGIGRFKNSLYAIKTKGGKTFTVWSYREIKQALQLRPFGKKIRIEFKKRIKDKKHTFGVLHFQINVGRGDGDPDLANNRKHAGKRPRAAVRRALALQSSTRPLMTVGRATADASTAKNKMKKIKMKPA